MRKQPVERQLISEHPTNPPQPDSRPASAEAPLIQRPVRGRLTLAAGAAAPLIPSAIGATAAGFLAISAAFAAASFTVRVPESRC